VVTFNSAHCISACIASLRSTLGDCEIIVVDNMSDDATVAVANSADEHVRVVSMERNAGYGSACNRGVVESINEHVILMNPDVKLERADVEALQTMFSEAPFGVLAPCLRYEDQRGAHPQIFERSPWLRELRVLALGPFRPRGLPDGSSAAESGSADWVSGAIMIVRRSEFLEIGGFDERFFLYYEDQELGLRYRRAGLPIRGTDAVTAVHGHGQSAADGDQRVTPMAWCLLGWLEFVAIHHGRRRARFSWVAIRASHRIGRRLVEWASIGGRIPRLRRKAEQLRSVDALVTQIARESDGTEPSPCPTALRVIKETSRA
jgi:GT2 family glycosyltransferase